MEAMSELTGRDDHLSVQSSMQRYITNRNIEPYELHRSNYTVSCFALHLHPIFGIVRLVFNFTLQLIM